MDRSKMLHNSFKAYQEQVAELRREIEVLTAERDNALLRIEELENRVAYLRGSWSDPDA